MRNRYAGRCACGTHVGAGHGETRRDPARAGKWVVLCDTCARQAPPPPAPGPQAPLVIPARPVPHEEHILRDGPRPHHVHLHEGIAGVLSHGWRGDLYAGADASWYGLPGHAEGAPRRAAMEARLRDGEHGIAAQARDLARDLESSLPPLPTWRLRLRRDEWGDDLDVSAALAGQLDRCWTRHAPAPAPRQGGAIVTLAASATVPAYVAAGEIALNAALLCACADALEASGRRVEIILAVPVQQAGARSDQDVTILVRVKRPDQPLDMLSVATACGPAAVRGACYEAVTAILGSYRVGLGNARHGEASRVGAMQALRACGITQDILWIRHVTDLPGAKAEAACVLSTDPRVYQFAE